jgi:hypothetical protein
VAVAPSRSRLGTLFCFQTQSIPVMNKRSSKRENPFRILLSRLKTHTRKSLNGTRFFFLGLSIGDEVNSFRFPYTYLPHSPLYLGNEINTPVLL